MNTREKMSEPFRILSEGTWLVYIHPAPSVLITSSKQPTPRGETSFSYSVKNWKN